MHEFLLNVHSVLRYVILVLLVVSALRSLAAWLMGGHYYRSDERSALFTVIFTHLQFLIGIALYFMSDKVRFNDMGTVMNTDQLRFYTVEHISMMLLAVVLITIGRSRAKKAYSEIAKHKRIAIFFLIALLLIFLAIPWPFMRSFTSTWI